MRLTATPPHSFYSRTAYTSVTRYQSALTIASFPCTGLTKERHTMSFQIPDKPVNEPCFPHPHPSTPSLASNASLSQVLITAALDWYVLEAPVTYAPADVRAQAALEVEEVKVLYRSDTLQPLGVVPATLHATQPDTVIEFFRSLAEFYQFPLTSAGSLHGGRLIWGLLQVGDQIALGADRHCCPHIILSHRFNSAAISAFSSICMLDIPMTVLGAAVPEATTRVHASREFLKPADLMNIGGCVGAALQLAHSLCALSTIPYQPSHRATASIFSDFDAEPDPDSGANRDADSVTDPFFPPTSTAVSETLRPMPTFVAFQRHIAQIRNPTLLDALLLHAQLIDDAYHAPPAALLHYTWFGEGARRKQAAVARACKLLL